MNLNGLVITIINLLAILEDCKEDMKKFQSTNS